MRDVSCGVRACTPSILAAAPYSAMGADGPPKSLQMLLRQLCSQMEVPSQALHWLLCRLCTQMEAPPKSLHWLLSQLCSQKEVLPQARVLALAPYSVQ